MTAPTVRTHTILGPGITCSPSGPDVLHGAAMTVTFSAAFSITKIPIEHEPKRGIESFIQVLAYSVTRRAVLESESQVLGENTRKKLHSFSNSTFGQMNPDDIWIFREGPVPLTVRLRFPSVMSKLMAGLMATLSELVVVSRLKRNGNELCVYVSGQMRAHTSLSRAFDLDPAHLYPLCLESHPFGFRHVRIRVALCTFPSTYLPLVLQDCSVSCFWKGQKYDR